MVPLVTSRHSWRVFATLKKMRIYLPVYQLTDWMAHVPAEGKPFSIHEKHHQPCPHISLPPSSRKELPNVCSISVFFSSTKLNE